MMKLKTGKTVIAAACATLIGSAMAQTADSAPDATLKSVTVTANKVEEKLKDVPQAVTLITGEALKEQGIRNIGDLVKEIPNMSSSYVYSNEVNFRGINASMFTNNNPVVFYIDGIPQSNRYSYEASLENVDRVEVLRGPQGTLYGKDSIGGVINIVTKTPQNAWTGYVGAEIGNQNAKELTFAANGALLKDQLYLSINGKAAGDDGWITNDYPGMNRDANRKREERFNVALLYKATPATQLRFNASHDDQSTYWIDGATAVGIPIHSFSRKDVEHVRFEQESVTKTVTDAQSLALRHDFGGMVMDAVLTHKGIKVDGDYDREFGDDPLYRGLANHQHATIDTQTQEIRFAGGKQGQLRWLAGLYLEQEKYRNTRYGMSTPTLYGNMDMNMPSTTESRSQAVFGQIMQPLSERLELTLGGRYQHIEKDFDASFYMQPLGTSGAPPVYVLKDASHAWNAFLPKAALSYDLTSQWKSYVSVAKGYLPGGYNYWPSSPVEADNRFKPQTSTNYEFGIRSDFGRLYLSAALFYMDIRDIHLYRWDMATNMAYTTNADKATSKGVELEASYMMNDHWEISGALGLARATYEDYPDAAVNGNYIEKTPAYTAKLGLQYTAGNGFYSRIDLRGQGKRYFDAENTVKDGAYATLDLKAGYKTGAWEYYGYIRNLTDTDYQAFVRPTDRLVLFGEPRRLGLGVRYSF